MSQELLIKFEDNQIRVIWDEGKEDYFFCVNDIVTALTGTVDSSNYLKQLRHRDAELSIFAPSTVIRDSSLVHRR